VKVYFEILLQDCCAKTAQDIFMGLGSWDQAAKEHMMAYDMQLKGFTTMYD
jgi:hypothetical protein